DAPVWIVISAPIDQRHLLVFPQRGAHRLVGGNEFALAMGNGQLQGPKPGRPNAMARPWLQVHPSIDGSSGIVRRRCRRLSARVAADRTGQQIGLHKYLESIADANDRLAALEKLADRLAQVMGDLIGKYATRGDVVAVAEASGDRENLKVGQRRRR